MNRITTQINKDGSTTVFNDGTMITVKHRVHVSHVERLNKIRKTNRLPERDKLITRLNEFGSYVPEAMQTGN